MRVLQLTARLFTSQRILWLPFLVVAAVEALGVLGVWLAAHPPYARLLAPPIRYFFGDQVLHYPDHLWLLYHTMPRVHLVASILVGGYCTALAAAMVRQTHEGQPPLLRTALYRGGIRYRDVTLLTLIAWLAFEALGAGLPRVLPRHPASLAGLLVAALSVQTLLAYAIPAAVYEQRRWWQALGRGAAEACRHPLSSLAVVAVPSLLVIGYSLWASDDLVRRTMTMKMPEIAVAFVAGRFAIQTVADAVMTVAVAHLWWLHRERA